MIVPCEVAVRSVVPAIKALVAQCLVEQHGLKQETVAVMLGMSQSGISKYFTGARGCAVAVNSVEDVEPKIASMVAMLLDGDFQRTEFLEVFCQVCHSIKQSGIVCQFCSKSDPNVKVQECGFCNRQRNARHER